MSMPMMNELRPCFIGDKKGLFHGWFYSAEVVAPSLMVGGHNGGQLATTRGMVEMPTGEIVLAFPTDIRFVGSERLMREYCYEEEKAND